MLLTVSYYILGVICLLALLRLGQKLLAALRAASPPATLPAKVISLVLGGLVGFIAAAAGVYGAAAVFFIAMDMPSDALSLSIVVYIAPAISLAVAYGLCWLAQKIKPRALAPLTLYSAFMVPLYFTLQPIAYNWLQLLLPV